MRFIDKSWVLLVPSINSIIVKVDCPPLDRHPGFFAEQKHPGPQCSEGVLVATYDLKLCHEVLDAKSR